MNPFTSSPFFVIFASVALAAPHEPPSAPVEKTIRERANLTVRWQQDAAVRDEALQRVRALLKRPLTVSSAVQIAVLNNRNLLATFEDLGVSAADLREAGLWKNPGIDLSVRFPDRAPGGINWEEAAAFDLLDFFMRPLRQRVAAEKLASGQLRVADAVLKLVAETKTAVYTLQADGQFLGQLRTILDANSAALELAQKQHEAGNIADLDLLRQQSAYGEARLEVAMAEAAQRGHREDLNRLLSLWGGDTAWKIASELPALPEGDVPLAGLESLAVAQRFDLAAAHTELAGFVRALGLTKTYRYIGALEFGVDTERDPDRTNVTGPTLHLELPLFNQGQARIAKGESELRRAERRFEGLAIDIRADVRALHDRLTAQRDAARFYRDELVPNRTAVAQQTLLRYNGMLAGNYELFSARAAEAEAGHKSIATLRDYWIARAELERAVGGNLHARPAAPQHPERK